MKTLLTIATIALVFSAISSLAPPVATADYSGRTPGRCEVVPMPNSTAGAADVVACTIISWAQVTLWMRMPD